MGEIGGFFAPLLNTAMETVGLDDDLDSRFVLLLSVGPDCHSGVLSHFKTSVLVQSLPRMRPEMHHDIQGVFAS